MYSISFSEQALKELALLMKSDIQCFKKIESIMSELREHPYSGTGQPHQLRHLKGVWSRRLDKKNRLRYTVDDNVVVVFVISTIGHYDDK